MGNSLLKTQLRISDIRQQRKMKKKERQAGSCGNNPAQNTSYLALHTVGQLAPLTTSRTFASSQTEALCHFLKRLINLFI